jgi:hypothetical protein
MRACVLNNNKAKEKKTRMNGQSRSKLSFTTYKKEG